jgi:transcriptional regulator with XRE-family HTH domain
MDLKGILDRIADRRAVLGLSEASVSSAAGSKDLTRNWRRSVEAGTEISVRHASLTAVARALEVPEDWLIKGSGTTDRGEAAGQGFAEAAVPFVMPSHAITQNAPQPLLSALFGQRASSPATYQISTGLPAFALAPGDVVVVDLARLPQPGDLAIVSMDDDETASSQTLLRRYVPPYLLSGEASQETQLMRTDDPGVRIRCAVIGSLRGIA